MEGVALFSYFSHFPPTLHILFSFKNFLMERKKETEEDREKKRPSISWFTHQMPVKAEAGWGKPRAWRCILVFLQVQGPRHLGHLLLLGPLAGNQIWTEATGPHPSPDWNFAWLSFSIPPITYSKTHFVPFLSKHSQNCNPNSTCYKETVASSNT